MIGRTIPPSDIQITGEYSSVISSEHVRLELLRGRKVRVYDINSGYGTWIIRNRGTNNVTEMRLQENQGHLYSPEEEIHISDYHYLQIREPRGPQSYEVHHNESEINEDFRNETQRNNQRNYGQPTRSINKSEISFSLH